MSTNANRIPVEKVATVDAFVEKFVTTNRLEQGLRETCDGVAEAKGTGKFLKWFGQDVKSESEAELETAGLEWKDVSKGVTLAAKKWWMEEVKRG